jgi:TP901 family phage tail tape measure protein
VADDYNIKVGVDPEGAKEGADEFKAATDKVNEGAKHAQEGVESLHESFRGLIGEEIKESLEGIEGALGSLNKILIGLGVGAVVVELRELVEQAKEMEESFDHLHVATEQTQQGMSELKEATRALSDEFGKNQLQIAAAQLEAAKSGFRDVATNTEVTTAALQLAKVSFTDVSTATNTLTRIMQAYNVSADQAANVSQSLFVATRSGKTDIGDLGQIFGRLAPYVQAAGVTINDTLSILSALGQTGGNVRVSMIGLQQILQDIAKPTPASAAAFENLSGSLQKMGISANSLKDLVDQKGLSGALQILNTAVGGSQQALARLLPGQAAAATAFTLTHQAAESLADIQDQLSKKSISFAEAFEKVTEGTSDQAERLKQNVQNSFLEIANKILEVLGPALTFINGHFEELKTIVEALAIAFISKLVISLVATTAQFVLMQIQAARVQISLAAMEGTGAAAAGGLLALDGAAAGLTTAMTALGGPIGIIALVIGGLAAFALNSGKSKTSSSELADEVDRLTGSFDELEKRQKTTLLDKLDTDLSTSKEKLKDLQTAYAEMNTQLSEGGEAGAFTRIVDPTQIDALKKHIEDTEKSAQKLRDNIAGIKPVPDVTGSRPEDAEKQTNLQKQLAALYEEFKGTIEGVTASTLKLADAQTLLTEFESGAYKQNVILNNLSEAQRADVINKLHDTINQLVDAQDKYNQQLAAMQGRVNPVVAAVNAYNNAVRELNRLVPESSRTASAYQGILARLRQEEEQSVIAAKAKLDNETATTEIQHTLIDLVSKQQAALVPLISAVNQHKVSQAALNDVLRDNALAIAGVVLQNQALESGEKTLAQSILAREQAEQKANEQGLQGDERLKFLAEFIVAESEAGRQADTLGQRLKGLVSQYDPLQASVQRYNEELAKLNDLEAARPDLKPQIEQITPVVQATANRDINSSLVLPEQLKAQVSATDDFRLAQAHLNLELQQGVINQDQYNQALLEQRENLAKSEAAYSDFAKGVQDAGKAAYDALNEFLVNPADASFKKLALSFVTSLQKSAATLLEDQAFKGLLGALTGSGNATASSLGLQLAAGAGVKLQGNTAAGGAGSGLIGAAAGQFSGANTALITAGTSLSGAAAQLVAAAASLSGSGVAGGGGGLLGDIGGLFGGGAGGDVSSAIQDIGTDAIGEASDSAWADALGALAGFAAGGNARAGQVAMVGEKGPELVKFGAPATVVPNHQVSSMIAAGAQSGRKPSQTVVSAPSVNVPVQVVNVDDPNKVPQALSSAQGQKSIINVISSNRSSIKQLLGS